MLDELGGVIRGHRHPGELGIVSQNHQHWVLSLIRISTLLLYRCPFAVCKPMLFGRHNIYSRQMGSC